MAEPTTAPIKQIVEPDLPAALEASKRDTKLTINCIQIGELQAFNPTNQTATIKLLIKQVIGIAPNGTKTLQEHPA